ncbi:hypothetical protein [Streptomyces sp. NPDC058457]
MPTWPPVISLWSVVPSPSWTAIPKNRLPVSRLPLIRQQFGLKIC